MVWERFGNGLGKIIYPSEIFRSVDLAGEKKKNKNKKKRSKEKN